MKVLFGAAVIALTSSQAFAQTPDATTGLVQRETPGSAPVDVSLATPTGHEVNATVGSYTYIEPGENRISIHGPKLAGEYTATLSVNKARHWFAQTNVRGTIGNVTYTGWCSPYLISRNSASPNGYDLDVGDPS